MLVVVVVPPAVFRGRRNRSGYWDEVYGNGLLWGFSFSSFAVEFSLGYGISIPLWFHSSW